MDCMDGCLESGEESLWLHSKSYSVGEMKFTTMNDPAWIAKPQSFCIVESE